MNLNNDNFKDTLEKNKVVMVDFWAPWCGPCRMLSPIMESLENDFKNTAVVGKVNVDEENQLASQFSIRAIPTVIIFKDGVEIERMSGMNSQSAYSDKINYYLN